MFSKLFSAPKADSLAWNSLSSEAQLNNIFAASFEVPQLIFKHSTRCSISTMALNRLERDWTFDHEILVPHYLDLLDFRAISDKVTQMFGVTHESPQALVIDQGKCVFHAEHNLIGVKTISEFLQNN